MPPNAIEMSLGSRARWAIVQEAAARKAGNVHPEAGFDDMNYTTFIAAATAIGESIDRAIERPLGELVLECTVAMGLAVGVNTGLGTILLIAPLVQCDHAWRGFREELLQNSWTGNRAIEFLEATTCQDSKGIYRAIAECQPGGLGSKEQLDVLGPPPDSILTAMRMASAWDDVALQYCNGYLEVAHYARRLTSPNYRALSLSDAVRLLQLEILSERVDSLIVRKWGLSVGRRVQQEAHGVLRSAAYGSKLFEQQWSRFDASLRVDGHRMNPGTSADLIAAALYIASDRWI